MNLDIYSAQNVKDSYTLKTGGPLYLLLILCLTYSFTKAQPPVKICTWKNGATGCYNIIHDDFGSSEVTGIINYADTMCHNRGLKMTFGAITSFCEANGSYAIAKQMIQRGHEIINHTHTHSCAVFNGSCGSGSGPNYGWAEVGPTLKFDVEIDQSNNSIASNTGYTPQFFIYPYDAFNESANDYLKSKGYIGARTRPYNQAAGSNFTPDAQGFFHTAFVADVDSVNNVAINLNARVDEAINNGTWVNRELHNVGNTGWGHVTVDDYRAHLDYVKSKVDAGQLWMGTISEILTYRIQRMEYTPVSSINGNTITVDWNAAGTLSIPSYLAPLQFKSPISLEVDITSYPCIYNVTQNGNVISDRFIKNGRLYINVYPHLGPVTITTASTSTTNAAVCSSQLPYTWNGQTYNAAGTYSVKLTNAVGCDSVATLNLSVKANSTSTTNTAVCSAQLPYSWNGQTYNAAGSYSVKLTNAAGCDSVATLNLSVKANSTSTTNAAVCSSQLPYTWNGQTYNAAGTYSVKLTNAAGCDSVATLNLSVKANSTSTTNTAVCSAQLPYTWNGQTYNAAGSYSVKLTNAAGCDSVATLNLSVKTNSTSTTNTAVCSSQLPYTWNGQTYNAAGTYSVKLTNAAGCDSVATLNLSVKANSTSTTNTAVCSAQLPYSWNGQTYNAAGSYSVKLTNAAGCDSVATLNLSVKANSTSTTNTAVCSSQLPYTWNGQTYNAAGSYSVKLTNAAGCDSTATLILTVTGTVTSTTNLKLCPSEFPYAWNGNIYNSAGTYVVSLKTQGGCDSIATLILTKDDFYTNMRYPTVNAEANVPVLLNARSLGSRFNFEWYPAIGLNFTTAANPTFRHDASVSYTIKIQSAVDGCSMVDTLLVNVINSKTAVLMIYPNPITGNINLQLTNFDKGTYDMILVNMLGQIVFKKTLNHLGGTSTQTIEANTLPSGTYHMKVGRFTLKVIIFHHK